MATKGEVYAELIKIQKSYGQGLSGIVTVLGGDAHLFRQYLDELIEEGLVECHDGGGSLGHPESNRWYMPTKGYNLWKDGIENGNGDTSYLTHVRFYLGQIDHDEEPENRENLAKWLSPSAQILIQNSEFMKSYSEWLERNSEELEIMKNLDDFYDEPTVVLTEDDINWVKTKSWYEKNKSISSCLKSSIKGFDTDEERLKITKRIIELYKSDTLKYKDDLKKALKDIEDHDSNILRRKRVNKWMESLDVEKLIQECI
jgi:hypothetical protein